MSAHDPQQLHQPESTHSGAGGALQQVLTLLEALEDALGHEAKALVAGDMAALSTHTITKRALLRELQGSMDPNSVSLAGQDVPELLARLHRCHALNQSTGAAIYSAMRHNAQVLSMLGYDSGPVAYAPHSSSSTGITHSGRSLASA